LVVHRAREMNSQFRITTYLIRALARTKACISAHHLNTTTMFHFPTLLSKNLPFCLAASFCLLFAACNQNNEKLQEREQRDEAAKAAANSTTTDADTVTLE